MIAQNITVSEGFRAQTKKAILSIVLFVLVFLTMIALAIWLTITGISWAIKLVMAAPGIWTIIIGIGLASVGLLVVFFLFKFLFKRHKTDRTGFIEVQRQEEPQLFELIDDIVAEVGTSFPKRVYLTHDVNAAVFFDSNFWSMFFPIRKNLLIGLGLVNTVSAEEFKAILAHEFGHFSQRSMKVGSYVYNVNQIIYNMLYDNQGFDQLVQGWASIHAIITLFVIGAIRIVQGIQWVLGHLYNLINLSYLSLSREMEFHADEIAAHVAGSTPMSKALLRVDLAQEALNTTISFYSRKISAALTSPNLYQEQQHVLHFLAQKNKLSVEDGLPQLSTDDIDKFNRSKLVIKNQWASHPSTEDRVAALQQLGIEQQQQAPTPANTFFQDIEQTQKKMTEQFFKVVNYEQPPTPLPLKQFITEFELDNNKYTFDPQYQGYYEHYNPMVFPLDQQPGPQVPKSMEELYMEEQKDLVYQYISLETDITTLQQIANGQLPIKTFDYDGVKHPAAESKSMAQDLEKELTIIKEKLRKNDQRIYYYFHNLANPEEAQLLKNYYKSYFSFDQDFARELEFYNQFSQRMEFIQYAVMEDEIRQNFKEIVPLEISLKNKLKALLNNPLYTKEIDALEREKLAEYLGHDLTYFAGGQYQEDKLNLMLNALSQYYQLLITAHFLHRKQILDFQVEIQRKRG